MIVVDASVAVKWLVSEQDQEAAQALLFSGEKLIGPSLARIEVTAAIARKARFAEIALQEALRAIELWRKTLIGALDLLPEGQDLHGALNMSLELRHPLPDCIYLALAERFNATLITADSKFVAKAHGRYPRVQLLGRAKEKGDSGEPPD